MDNKDIYYSLLEQVRVRMGFIKGVDSFFDLFIDPITRDVLRDMRAPTDMRDLLLYTVTLLTTSEHLPASSESNFRYRNVEQVTAIIYNEMARAFAGYKNKSVGAGTCETAFLQDREPLLHDKGIVGRHEHPRGGTP